MLRSHCSGGLCAGEAPPGLVVVPVLQELMSSVPLLLPVLPSPVSHILWVLPVIATCNVWDRVWGLGTHTAEVLCGPLASTHAGLACCLPSSSSHVSLSLVNLLTVGAPSKGQACSGLPSAVVHLGVHLRVCVTLFPACSVSSHSLYEQKF